MLSLKKQKAVVAHINVREEKHGEDSVLALDVKVKADVSSVLLDALAPGLRLAMYMAPAGDSAQPTASFVDSAELTALRFPQVQAFPWKADQVGAQFVLHGGKKDDGLEFKGVNVNKLTLCPKEGGTVELTFRVQISEPSPAQVSAVSGLLGKETKVSVRAGQLDLFRPKDAESEEPAPE